MNALKTILSLSLVDYSFQLQEAFEEGWRLDTSIAGAPYFSGFAYQTQMTQDEATVPVPKRSRSEILADARAAKAAKKADENE